MSTQIVRFLTKGFTENVWVFQIGGWGVLPHSRFSVREIFNGVYDGLTHPENNEKITLWIGDSYSVKSPLHSKTLTIINSLKKNNITKLVDSNI